MKAVIDTNVLLVANRMHDDVSDECLKACVEFLETIKANGRIVIDDAYRIVTEYQNKTTPFKNQRAGDVFLLWLLKNIGNTKHVERVAITEIGSSQFQEFPVQTLQARVDAPDRKFIATAAAAGGRTSVIQATDCKWLDWWPELKSAGVPIRFICPDDVCSFYRRKFPDRECPVLP